MGVAGREFLPSRGESRVVEPELITADALLGHHGISREQLVDLAILMGTDFNDGIKGIGPKKALKLVQQHGRIEHTPAEIRRQVPGYDDVRAIYLDPDVAVPPVLAFGEPDEDGLVRFLCEEREFSRERVSAALVRMRKRPHA